MLSMFHHLSISLGLGFFRRCLFTCQPGAAGTACAAQGRLWSHPSRGRRELGHGGCRGRGWPLQWHQQGSEMPLPSPMLRTEGRGCQAELSPCFLPCCAKSSHTCKGLWACAGSGISFLISLPSCMHTPSHYQKVEEMGTNPEVKREMGSMIPDSQGHLKPCLAFAL